LYSKEVKKKPGMVILRVISELRREVDVLVRHPLYLTTQGTIQKRKVYVECFSVLNEATFTKEDPTGKQKTKSPHFVIFHKVCTAELSSPPSAVELYFQLKCRSGLLRSIKAIRGSIPIPSCMIQHGLQHAHFCLAYFYVPPLSLLQHFAFIIHFSETKLTQPEFYHQHKSTVSTDTYLQVLTSVPVHFHECRYQYRVSTLGDG